MRAAVYAARNDVPGSSVRRSTRLSSTSSLSAGPSSAAAAARHTYIQSSKAGSFAARASSRARSYADSAAANSPLSRRTSASCRVVSAAARRASVISVAFAGPRLVRLHLLESDELADLAAGVLREGRPVARERRVVEGRVGRSGLGRRLFEEVTHGKLEHVKDPEKSVETDLV